MSNKIYNKSIRRTIFGSMGRFIAILAIIALGVGFFAGVKNTKGSMMLTCDKYVTDYRLYNFRLLSTYGFTEEDEKALNQIEGVRFAEGSVTADFFSQDNEGNSIIVRAHSITENINLVDLQAGRMPESPKECIADDYFYSESDIGKVIKVTAENDKETKDLLEYKEYKIVGITKSPNYLTKEDRGTTSLGDGSVNTYIYVPQKALTSEYFTEMFIYCEKQGFIFSEEYDKNMDNAEEVITLAAEKRGEIRYEEIIREAREELEEGRAKFLDGKADFEEGKAQYLDGKAEYEEGKAEFEREKANVLNKLDDAKATLDENKAKLVDGKKELAENKSKLESNKIEVEQGIAQVKVALEGALANPETPEEVLVALQTQFTQLEGTLTQINSGLETISTKENELINSERQLNAGYAEYNANKAEANRGFETAEAELEEAERELADARVELANAEAELEEAERELADAEKEIEEIEKTEIYVQTRTDNMGFGSFESNADIVDSIAKVFPVFFFLIAALVCSTTMTRMVEEERTQIGALRAMGFSTRKIMWKYIVYSGSAAIIGCLIGFLLGSKFFPYFIWVAYGMMFGFAPLEFYFSWGLASISLVGSIVCSVGTTYLACRSQLKSTPAEILRPKAPSAGKRILLEKIPFVWERMKFLYKVSARNIFRYKKRMFMMIVGIGGCAALVLAGFGINDSIAGISEHQYDNIEMYDTTVAFEEAITDKDRMQFENKFDDELSNIAVLQQTSVNIKGPKAVKSTNLMITDDHNITDAVSFKLEEANVDMPGKGEALLTNKIAEVIGAEVGDQIVIEYDDIETVTLTVSGIYRNYVNNYIYITDETYEKDFSKEYEPNMMYVTVKDESKIREVSENINGFDGVVGVYLVADQRAGIDNMMLSLNYIIILVIACAGALAFIVLFNLGNINITEREREIATIKVLGFYSGETGAYVFRENFILVLMGIAAGLPLGLVLHKFIMDKISVDTVAFNEVIEPMSYLYTVIVVICFSVIVDIIMRRKLKKINMAEALKSIE